MSRQWISKKDQRWVMRCDECTTVSDPRPKQDDLPLSEFAAAGWFIAKIFGDQCPVCVKKAGGIDALVASGKAQYGTTTETVA